MTSSRDRPGPALSFARASARRDGRAIFLLDALRTTGRLGFAAGLALTAGRMIEAGTLEPAPLAGAFGALLVGGAAGWVAARRAARAEAGVAAAVLSQAEARLCEMPVRDLAGRPRGALVAGIQRHPGALARLVVSHAGARRTMALGPLLAVAAIAPVSWEAAAALILAMPLMIVFFALVGGLIQKRADTREAALGRLAAQFSDRVRALPTILANHGLERETQRLEARIGAYARGTMSVLAVAFLNSGILDFFSSLSIAVLAVFLGLGHLGLLNVPGFDHLALWQSLFILLVAPEYFAPFRRYAELYHAKAEGAAAAEALDWIFAPVAEGRALPDAVDARLAATTGLTWPTTGLVAITGASGTGKTTLLRRLAGVDTGAGAQPVGPPIAGERVSWVSTETDVAAGTLSDALVRGTDAIDRDGLTAVAGTLGLLDDALLPGGLDAPIHSGGENLSGGQRLRIAVARMLLATGPAFCDEPTAKLDADNAERVRRALRLAAASRLVVVATHDAALAALADARIDLAAPQLRPEAVAA
ncbi:ABC transporter transmembrane domain-containing protein [Jiella avicenniae]|uniref:ATP-binding cassette domain-containing protein n=1 Tax=Jiella avicenniae TaxID=2907202 RepID=A0A9X1P1C8_9HYPH|nr:ABC transporter transmembrane domain-containing protein [Jiella avicenniae]MCE7028049.1 ATP-binding cassette domain-containing protein [Jiella avicenniae]